MDTASKIGLLPGFGWVTGTGNFFLTLMICWLVTPVGMIAVGLICESRMVPLRPSRQFLSFFPGDIFLGVAAAGLLVMARQLPAELRWYNATAWHVIVLVFTALVAVVMTYGEWKSGVYPTRAIFSPTKLYHNILLYVGYGYVIVTTLVAVVAGLSWSSRPTFVAGLACCLVPGVIWGVLVVKDNSLSTAQSHDKAAHAHVGNWEPFWRLP